MSYTIQEQEYLLNPYNYFQVSSDEGKVIDPLSGEGLCADAFPAYLKREPFVVRALEYLQTDQLHVDVFGGYHGDAPDFQDITTQHSAALHDLGALGIEANWQLPDGPGSSLPEPLLPAHNPRHTRFMDSQISWCDQNNVIPIPCDIDGPEDPLRQGLQALLNVSDRPYHPGSFRSVGGPARNRLRHITTAAYYMARLCLVPATFAVFVETARNNGTLDPAAKLGLTIGRLNLGPLTARMQQMGFEVTPHDTVRRSLPPVRAEDNYETTFHNALATGHMDEETMRKRFPF